MTTEEERENNPYQRLKKELDQTGVISDDFKGRLLGYMMAALDYGREYGRAEGMKMLGVEQDPDSKKWYILDEKGERLHGPYPERPRFPMRAEAL